MKLWIKIIAGIIPAAAVLLLSIPLIRCVRRRRQQRQQQLISPQTPLPQLSKPGVKSKFDTFQAGINKFHLSYKSGSSARNSLRFHHLSHHHHHPPAMPPSSPFNWDEHPRLVADAVETGWPRFAFSASIPRAPSSPLWAFCPACDGGTPPEAAGSGWDLPAGSPEFMQTVRLNPGLKNTSDEQSFSFVRASLPLPGPASGGGSFPQEAYFEITILYLQPRKKLQETAIKQAKERETDRSKLITGNSISATSPIIFSPQEPPTSSTEYRKSSDLAVSIGLISRASMSNQSMPGTFPGSIGFHSEGSIYLDGKKLVFESEKAEWADVNRVIGCGFVPRKKKVFFTVDSRLVLVLHCSSEAFSSPLYPVLAADADAMILVNLGQAPFKYAPANATRTQNPCFFRLPSGGRPPADAIGSRELSSVARMEAEWCEHGKRSKNQNNYYSSSSKKSIGYLDDGLEAESDLFEISLQR